MAGINALIAPISPFMTRTPPVRCIAMNRDGGHSDQSATI